MPDCFMTLTIATVESWDPCVAWTRERLEEIAAGRAEVPLLEILRRGDITVSDRVWVGCHALPEIRWWCADRAVRLHAPKALDAAGLHERATRLRDLPKIVDVETVRASWDVVRDSAWAETLRRRGQPFTSYHCPTCGRWHATRLRDLPKIVDVETVRASWDVVRDSAWDATWAAMDAVIAMDAARDSLAATCGAANDAAWDAALAAAISVAEQQTQLDRLIMLAEKKS